MNKMFTPRTPDAVFLAGVFCIALIGVNLGIAQSKFTSRDSALVAVKTYRLANITEYEASWQAFCSAQYVAADYELKELKNKWWYYLPGVGVTFGLPNINFSTSTVAQIDKDKRERKLKRMKLHANSKLTYNEGLQRIRILYEKVRKKTEKIEYEFAVFALHKDLFEMSVHAYQKGDLHPEQRIQSEIAFEERRNRLLILADDVYELVLILEEFSRYKMPNRSFYDPEPECILESREFQQLQDVLHK